MSTKILKFWHQWSWAYHIIVTVITLTVLAVTYQNAIASNTKEIEVLKAQHATENMAIRVAVQENTSNEINRRLSSIEEVQSKIFERINHLTDRENR